MKPTLRLVATALFVFTATATGTPTAASAQGFDEAVPPPFGEAPLGAGLEVDRGWSVGAFWLGVGSAVAVLATGIAAAAAASPDDRIGTGLGVTSMGILSVAGPTVAFGASSARGHPYVPGARGVRISAWILYSLSILTGGSLLAIDIDQNDGGRAAFAVTAGIGAVSLVLFAFDALVSAIQADFVSGRN